MNSMCAMALHPAGDVAKSGHCRGCKNLNARRARAAERGEPLCWTGDHAEPEPGLVCGCGEPPPEETWVDWAMVEGVLNSRQLPRDMTPAEELSALRTVSQRFGGGMYDAASWINEYTDVVISDRRVEYLLDEWLPRTGSDVLSVEEIIAKDYFAESQTTATVELAAVA